MIKFKVKKLTETAKLPTQENKGDLWDLYADDFKIFDEIDVKNNFNDNGELENSQSIGRSATITSCDGGPVCKIKPQGRILVKTGISLELPIHTESEIRKQYIDEYGKKGISEIDIYDQGWQFNIKESDNIIKYAVADIRPRSGLALKHGITVLNTPGTIDNSYRKEIGIILINNGHEPYTIEKGDKIAQMLIRELEPSEFEEVKEFTGEDVRGGFGSTGR